MNEEEVTDLIQNLDNISEPFKVYVRIRPFLPKECQKLRRNNSTSLITNTNFFENNIYKSIFAVYLIRYLQKRIKILTYSNGQ